MSFRLPLNIKSRANRAYQLSLFQENSKDRQEIRFES